MTWLIRNRTGRWFVGRGDNRCEAAYRLTRYETDAARFPTREAAEEVRTEYLATFQSAYELIQSDDDDLLFTDDAPKSV